MYHDNPAIGAPSGFDMGDAGLCRYIPISIGLVHSTPVERELEHRKAQFMSRNANSNG